MNLEFSNISYIGDCKTIT